MASGRAFFSILLFFFHPPFFPSFQTLGSIGHWRFVSLRFVSFHHSSLASTGIITASGAGVGLAGQGRANLGFSSFSFLSLFLSLIRFGWMDGMSEGVGCEIG